MPMSLVCSVPIFVATISLILVSLSNVAAQSATTSNKNSSPRCAEQQTCGACVAADCFWCRQPHHDTNTTARCSDSRRTLVDAGCSDDMIQAANASLTVHNDTQPHSGDAERDAIQLAPQAITVRVKPNKPFTFPVTFRLAENFPVDLYFLMDVSNTMDTFRMTLVNMTDQMAEAIGNITTNYRLGLGAYVEKLVMPYSSMGQYQPPFTFRNILPLTRDKHEFRRMVNETANVNNVDVPEAVLDAIVQAIACWREIGWRNQSRKLIVVSTDGDFHLAGDGLLGGIIKPNDRRCHLDAVGDLTLMDYPSISEVADLVVDNNINLIFTVPINSTLAVEAYSRLMRHIEGSNVARLESNCSNVVKLIRESYEKISSTVQLKSDTSDSAVSVSFRSRCLPGSGPERETSTCEGLQMRQSVTFDVTVEVRVPDGKCPADRRLWSRGVVIYPAGLTDRLTVNIELDCECPCEQPAAAEPTSPLCNSLGSLKCGICACDDGFYGDTCQCSSDTDVCRSSGNSSTAECSDRGRCDCGRCRCNAIRSAEPDMLYSGRFCECNDYACEHYAGKLCGGPRRGRCVCGECNCAAGWTGARCECSTATDRCTTKTGKLCNDAGTCECNECRCTKDLYKGPTCEDCPTCTDGGRCQQFAECIKCHFQSQSCPNTCANADIDVTDDVETDVTDEWPSNVTVVCRARLDEFCVARFAYNFMTGALRADRRKVCTKPPDVTMIIVGVVIGILVLGLVLLFIWKAYVTAHDRREYAQFKDHLKDTATSSMDNPLYRNAVTKYQNPTYDRGSHDKLA